MALIVNGVEISDEVAAACVARMRTLSQEQRLGFRANQIEAEAERLGVARKEAWKYCASEDAALGVVGPLIAR